MSYDHEEFDYLCALFDASRDALRLHSGWEDIAEEFDELGAAVRQSDFSTQILERIKQAIIQHIGVNTRGGLNIGQDVINVTLPTVVLKVPGVVDFDLQISSDGEHFSWKNIEIAAREKAVTDESMVIVE